MHERESKNMSVCARLFEGDRHTFIYGSRAARVCVPDVILASSEMTRPVAGLPESVAVHLPPALTERRVPIWSSLQVKVTQLLQVCTHNLRESKSIYNTGFISGQQLTFSSHHVFKGEGDVLKLFVLSPQQPKPEIFISSYQIDVNDSLCLHLVSVYKQDFVDSEGEQHVQEEDFVAPDDPLLLCLLV